MTPIRLRPTMMAGLAMMALVSAASAQQVVTLTPTSNAEAVWHV